MTLVHGEQRNSHLLEGQRWRGAGEWPPHAPGPRAVAPFARAPMLALTQLSKFVKLSLEFVDFHADLYRNFMKSCRIKKKIRYFIVAEHR